MKHKTRTERVSSTDKGCHFGRVENAQADIENAVKEK